MAIDILTADAETPKTCTSSPRPLGTSAESGVDDSKSSEPTRGPLMAASADQEDSLGQDDSSEQGRGEAADVDASKTNDAGHSAAEPSLLSDLIQLTKPRIVVMILVTTVASGLIGGQGSVGLIEMAWLLLGTALIAGSAGAANQVWERVIDQRMTRTAKRPLPSGRMETLPVIAYTAALGVAGTAILYLKFSAVPAAVGIATWLMYVLIYTPMKTRTAWNTTVGAVAGAIPMLIGYTATGGSLGDLTGWLLVGVLVAWQYPHFMAIAWMYRRQYAEAGFHMSTTVDPTGRSAAIQSIAGSLALIACAVTLCWLPEGRVGAVVATAAVLWSVWPMLRASIRFAADPSDTPARGLLRKSLLVLPAVVAIVTIRLFW